MRLRADKGNPKVWHSACFSSLAEADVGVVGPDICRTPQGFEGGRSGNSPVPAHMGAWPEREAPAEKLASADFTVERGNDSSFPLSLLDVCSLISTQRGC